MLCLYIFLYLMFLLPLPLWPPTDSYPQPTNEATNVASLQCSSCMRRGRVRPFLRTLKPGKSKLCL